MSELVERMMRLQVLCIEFTIYFPSAGFIGLKYWYKDKYMRAIFYSQGGALLCEDEYVNEKFVISDIN